MIVVLIGLPAAGHCAANPALAPALGGACEPFAGQEALPDLGDSNFAPQSRAQSAPNAPALSSATEEVVFAPTWLPYPRNEQG